MLVTEDIEYLAGYGACLGNGEGKMNQKPNVIYILADDMGYGDIKMCIRDSSGTPLRQDQSLRGSLGSQSRKTLERAPGRDCGEKGGKDVYKRQP